MAGPQSSEGHMVIRSIVCTSIQERDRQTATSPQHGATQYASGGKKINAANVHLSIQKSLKLHFPQQTIITDFIRRLLLVHCGKTNLQAHCRMSQHWLVIPSNIIQ